MFEKYIHWYFKNCLGRFSKENRRKIYEQHKYWYAIFVCISLLVALLLGSLGATVMYYFISYLKINVVQIVIIATIIFVIEKRGISFINKKFRAEITNKVYPILVTKRGKAISKSDFRKINELKPGVYSHMMSKACIGFCFFTSWALLDVLQKGYMQFVAVEQLYKIGVKENEHYKIHVLYVNQGWCFDTYTQRQIPIEEFYRIFNGKPIARYKYTDIESKSYEAFYESITPKLKEWCKTNDCSYFVTR